ncbi:hypothetical protein B6I75_21870 [Klebsiella pneumoniae]|nr:hypothetical protein B6I75_21870 [Klebsiella pneumoniae]
MIKNVFWLTLRAVQGEVLPFNKIRQC